MSTGEEGQKCADVTTEEGGEEERREREGGGGGVGVVASLVGKAKGFVAEKIAQIPKPEASLERVSFKGVGRDCITLHSHVDVSNPYAHRIPICELSYTFKSGGKYVHALPCTPALVHVPFA